MKERTGRTVTAGRIGGLLEDAAESVVEVGLPTLVTAGILTRLVPGSEALSIALGGMGALSS